MGLLITTTPITIKKVSNNKTDQWGVHTHTSSSIVAKARAKTVYKSSDVTSVESVEGQDNTNVSTLTFNGFVNIGQDDMVYFNDDYGNQVEAKVGEVNFIKDMGGKILLTKGVVSWV